METTETAPTHTDLNLIQRIQQARWEFGRAKGLTADEAALYAEGVIDVAGQRVAS